MGNHHVRLAKEFWLACWESETVYHSISSQHASLRLPVQVPALAPALHMLWASIEVSRRHSVSMSLFMIANELMLYSVGGKVYFIPANTYTPASDTDIEVYQQLVDLPLRKLELDGRLFRRTYDYEQKVLRNYTTRQPQLQHISSTKGPSRVAIYWYDHVYIRRAFSDTLQRHINGLLNKRAFDEI